MTLDLVCGIVIGFALGMLMSRNANTKMMIAAAQDWWSDIKKDLDSGQEFHASVHLARGSFEADDLDDDDGPGDKGTYGYGDVPGEQWRNN